MATFMREFEHLKIPLEIIKSATNNFSADRFIAEGGYGKVYRGEFSRAQVPIKGAVKRWSLSNEEGDPEFQREVMLLSDNKHENLISLIGFCYEDNERILVYEFAANKSLDFHLQNPKLGWIQRLNICLGAARGLEYLHNPKGTQRVLHCDIKSANILLDENWNAKIADFGLSKYGPANQNRSYLITQAKGTYGYIDPAFLETMVYTKECDVYSFGVVLFEVLCSRLCFDSKYPNQFLVTSVNKRHRASIRERFVDVNLLQQMAENSLDAVVTVAQKCLGREQKQRPSMAWIVRSLESAITYQEQRYFFPINWNFASSSTTYAQQEKRDLLAQKEQDETNIIHRESGEKLDDLINKWSNGKEGNLWALLSTLHNILGSESTWEQVSVTRTINTGYIRTLYSKAVYKCEPYMLESRGASIEEKYICGKVVKILKEGYERLEYDVKDLLRILGDKYDDVIRSWSSGKEGDIHALLSTLHHILGAEIGWKPVSVSKTLTTSDNVRRLRETALHLLRPAFLENVGATIKEMYIYGKVNELLEVGYNTFVSEERDRLRLLGNLYDDDVRRWSEGKERDLGYLLSNLQHILGHESCWEPVSLDGPVTTRFLGDAYRKSLLLTDPNTLIQRGASGKETYIYGEVRKILKAGWDCAPAEQKWKNTDET